MEGYISETVFLALSAACVRFMFGKNIFTSSLKIISKQTQL